MTIKVLKWFEGEKYEAVTGENKWFVYDGIMSNPNIEFVDNKLSVI